jgi:hypothetical protein
MDCRTSSAGVRGDEVDGDGHWLLLLASIPAQMREKIIERGTLARTGQRPGPLGAPAAVSAPYQNQMMCGSISLPILRRYRNTGNEATG